MCVCIGIGFLHILSPSHIFRERRDADEIRCGECTSGFKLLRVYVYIIGEGGGLVFLNKRKRKYAFFSERNGTPEPTNQNSRGLGGENPFVGAVDRSVRFFPNPVVHALVPFSIYRGGDADGALLFGARSRSRAKREACPPLTEKANARSRLNEPRHCALECHLRGPLSHIAFVFLYTFLRRSRVFFDPGESPAPTAIARLIDPL